MCMEAQHRVRLHQNGASQSYHRDYFARWSWRLCLWFNKMCSLPKKKNSKHCLKSEVDWLQHTTSYYQISSPDLTWTTASVYVVLVGLHWPHQSLNKVPKRLLMWVNTFNFLCFEMGKEHKKDIANLSEWVRRCAKAGVQLGRELIYILQSSQHFKATKLRAHET